METLTWYQYYWQALQNAMEFPNNILAIIGIVILLLKLVPPKIEAIWGTSRMNKYYLWTKEHSLKLFAGLLLVTLVYAPYGMYKELDTEYQKICEENKPTLTLDPVITLNAVNRTNKMVNLTFKFKVNNIGQWPAYQMSAPLFCGPLDDAEKTKSYDNIYDINPFYKGTENKIQFDHVGYYSQKDNTGIIIIYIKMRWNNAPAGEVGRWYQVPYWYTYYINLDTVTGVINPSLPSEINQFVANAKAKGGE